MWDYIAQEEKLLSNVVDKNKCLNCINNIEIDVENIYIVAHGSSYNAAITIMNTLLKECKIRTLVFTPANFINNSYIVEEDNLNTLVIGISQTGTSRGVLEALEYAKSNNFKILSVSAIKDSLIEKLSDYKIDLMCGDENSNAKTKGYSSTIVNLMLIAYALSHKKKIINENEYNNKINNIKNEIHHINGLIPNIKRFAVNNEIGKKMKDLYVLGYGKNYGSALECQLKMMETMCIPTMYNDIIEFSHGMHRSIKKDSTLLLISTDEDEQMKDLTIKTYNYMKNICENVFLINASDNEINDKNVISLPYYKDDSSILLIILVIQILSVFAPEYNGLDPNRFANDNYTDYVQTRI